MARATHPNRAVEDALRHAEANEWRVQVGGSHAWGKIYCPYNDEECRCGEYCITSVEYSEEPGEPRSPAQAGRR